MAASFVFYLWKHCHLMMKDNHGIVVVAANQSEAGTIREKIPKLGKRLDFPEVENGDCDLFQLSFFG